MVSRLLKDREHTNLALIGCLGIGCLALMVHTRVGLAVVTALSGIYVMRGLFEPLMQDSLNRRLDSDKRASCLSIAKMGQNLLAIFLGPLFGYFADVWSLTTSLHIFQWTFTPLLLVGMIWGWQTLGRAAEPEPAIEATTD